MITSSLYVGVLLGLGVIADTVYAKKYLKNKRK